MKWNELCPCCQENKRLFNVNLDIIERQREIIVKMAKAFQKLLGDPDVGEAQEGEVREPKGHGPGA